jgi:hypothetical protein
VRSAYLSSVEFRFERRARSRKARSGLRSWLGRAPDAREVAERLRRLAPRIWKGRTVEVSSGRVSVVLHPYAPALQLTVAADADLVVAGEAGGVGPGYVEAALGRLAPVLDELDYAWADEAPASGVRDEILAWLAGELAAGATRIGMPAGRSFAVDAAVHTAMGPRDAAWRDAVLGDPAAGRDAFAWWDAGPGQLARSRAVLAMWHEVAWRPPVDDDERAVIERVDADLVTAREALGDAALPLAEWAELAALLGDDERAGELRGRATGPAVIGYRRFDMVVDVGGGWAITLPGAFVGRWEDGGERYWATDGRRVVEVERFETADGDADWLIDAAPPLHPVIEQLTDGGRRGRAEAHDEDDVQVVHGLVAVAPHVAMVTCRGSADDRAWALATWRSLRMA